MRGSAQDSRSRIQPIAVRSDGRYGVFHNLNPPYLRLLEPGFPLVGGRRRRSWLLNDQAVFIVVSHSGRSAEVIRPLDHDGQQPTSYGVTHDITSPVAQKSDFVALIQAGPQTQFRAKTNTAAQAARSWIGDSIRGRDAASAKTRLMLATAAGEEYVGHFKTHFEEDVRTTGANVVVADARIECFSPTRDQRANSADRGEASASDGLTRSCRPRNGKFARSGKKLLKTVIFSQTINSCKRLQIQYLSREQETTHR